MMGKYYRRLVGWGMQTRPYRYMLKHVIPYIRFTTYYTSMRGWKYHQIYNAVQPGDIILTTDKKIISIDNPGRIIIVILRNSPSPYNIWR